MYSTRKKSLLGFSLIEIMVVFALISAMAAIGTFYYRTYIIRAKIAEVFVYAESVQRNIENYYANNERFPSSASVATYDRLTPNNNNIQQVSYYACTQSNAHSFAILLRSSVTGVAGNEIVFTVIAQNGRLQWYCRQAGNPAINQSYLPVHCGTNATFVGCSNDLGAPSVADP